MAFRNIKKWIFLLISTLLISSVFIQSTIAEPRISKAVFAKSVKNHKPINQLDTLSDDLDKLYFFTDIRGYQGHTITHQWTYGNWVVQSLPFTIKGHRWRVSSSKTLDKKMKGKWTVKVLDEKGRTLQENSIAYSGSASQVTPKDKVTINLPPKQNKTEENKKEEKPKRNESTEKPKKQNDDNKMQSKEVSQKSTDIETPNINNTNKVENKAELKPEEAEKQIDSNNHSDSSKKNQPIDKNSDDGDEEDCEPDEVETSTPNKSETEALLTDDDFELKADTKEDESVAKMAASVIEQLEKIPTNNAGQTE